MRKRIAVAAFLPLVSGGCVARAAWDVATFPVKAIGKTADVLTTSEKERDEKWVRQQRKAEEALEKEARKAAKRERSDSRDFD